MTNIPAGFPSTVKSKKLLEITTSLTDEIHRGLVGSHLLPLVTIGQNELLRRYISDLEASIDMLEGTTNDVRDETIKVQLVIKELLGAVSDLKKITHNAAIASEISNKNTQRINTVSVIVAFIFAVLSAVFAFEAYRSSNNWQDRQLPVLEDIRSELKAR